MKPESRLLSEILLRRLEVVRLKISRQTLGILDLGIEVVRSNIDELSADIGEKHLEAKPLFYLGSPSGL